MKKIQQAILFVIVLLGFSFSTNAQGWNQDKKGIYSVGVGGTQVIAFGNGFAGLTGPGLSINVSGEYKVQRFVGLGFETGIDLFFGPYYLYTPPPPPRPRYVSLGFPLGLKVNVHILEAANVPIANKLDVYAGLNVGGGPGVYVAPAPFGSVFGFIHVGPQVGIRYWPNHNIAVFGEFGWGATFANVGLTF
jgi:hypothetical protein